MPRPRPPHPHPLFQPQRFQPRFQPHPPPRQPALRQPPCQPPIPPCQPAPRQPPPCPPPPCQPPPLNAAAGVLATRAAPSAVVANSMPKRFIGFSLFRRPSRRRPNLSSAIAVKR